MLKRFKRMAAPPILRMMRSVLSKYNYEVVRKPDILRRFPSAELAVSLDFVLADYLRKRSDVSFVQIGGFDGRSGDPLFPYVTRFHWKGLIVEPQSDAFETLRANYSGEPQVVLENVAVAEREGTRTLWRIRRGVEGLPSWAPQLASFDRDTVARHRAQIPNIDELIEGNEVRCMTFDALVVKSGLRKIDILQIDVEGYDFEILKLVDFKRHKPSIIHYEHAHLSPDDREACLELLVRHGYKIGIETYDTIAYAVQEANSSSA
jgi:FkbM family methyltransferase